MKYLSALLITFFITGCSAFSPPGASYSFEKHGDNIIVQVSDTQEIKDLDASAEPIVLKDGTVICCKVSIKKKDTKSIAAEPLNVVELLKLIKTVSPLIAGVP